MSGLESSGAAESRALVLEREILPPRLSPWRLALRMGLRKPLGAFSALIIVLVFGAAIFAGWPPLVDMKDAKPFLARYEAEESFFHYDEAKFMEIGLQKEAPSAAHWLGTDDQARDTWSRIVWGSRRSLRVGLGALALGTIFGVLIAFISAYSRGLPDLIIQRIMDAFQAFPPILFLILMVTITDPTENWLTFALAVISIPSVSRIVRSVIITTREMPYIEAARAIGAGAPRIMIRHIFPNVTAPIIIIFSIGVGVVILAEASLSFLGLGPPGVSWGEMLNQGRLFVLTSPWQALFSGMAITLAVLAFNLAGDALRDILDPRLRI
jgi:peptide/nickel transport system permease protein